MRVVTLGDGKQVPLGAYVEAWRRVRELEPSASLDRGLCSRDSTTAGDVLREFRNGMHDRINRHIPGFGIGRKWSWEWQTETRRAAHDLNNPRLRFYWLPDWLRPRFEHRIARHDD